MARELSDEVSEFLALRILDLVDPVDVVRWAEDRVAGGEDSESLVELAGQPRGHAAEIDAPLLALAGELGSPQLTEFAVGMIAARGVARELGQGVRDPHDAARRIWRIARLAPSSEPVLRDFIGLASEWEGDPKNRGFYEEDIRSTALGLARWAGPIAGDFPHWARITVMDFLRVEAFQSMFIVDGGAGAALPPGRGGPVLAGPEAIFIAGRIESDAPTLFRMGGPGGQGDLVLAYTGELATPRKILRVVTIDQEVLGEVSVPDSTTLVAVYLTDLEEPDEIYVAVTSGTAQAAGDAQVASGN